jgi:putative SOS response-associated peptidase YedK
VCARYQTKNIKDLIDRLDVFGEMLAEEYEALPTDPVSAIVRNPKLSRNEFMTMRWGLVPRWADDRRIAAKLINARSETLTEKPAFREAFAKRRCILPMSLFFEFDETSRYRISRKDGQAMAVAGLWEARKWEGEPLVTCTLITTTPNELIARVHDRMPVILHEEDYEAWLDPSLSDVCALQPMLVPFESDQMMLEFDGLKKTRKRS